MRLTEPSSSPTQWHKHNKFPAPNGTRFHRTNQPETCHTWYDARGYRIAESYPQGGSGVPAGTTNYIYYDANWQAIETRTNGTAASNVTSQMVWSAAYINAAVLQDSYSGGVIQPNSRLYFTQDANWDTTAVIGYDSTTQTWGVVQRYVYSPYGTITVLNADWSTPPTGTQPLVNNLYQGMTLDAVTGLYYERNRDYSPSLGRWMEQDPAQFINGANTYQFVNSSPAGNVDAEGLNAPGALPHPLYLTSTDLGSLAESIGERLQADSMSNFFPAYKPDGAAFYVGKEVDWRWGSGVFSTGLARAAVTTAENLGKLLLADNPIGWAVGVLGFKGKSGVKLGIRLAKAKLENMLLSGDEIEVYRVSWQVKKCNGWNTGGMSFYYNSITRHFWGEINGSVGQVDGQGHPDGLGTVHPFFYFFAGRVVANWHNVADHIASFVYPATLAEVNAVKEGG